jgi:nucleoid-associated protein YgaU
MKKYFSVVFDKIRPMFLQVVGVTFMIIGVSLIVLPVIPHTNSPIREDKDVMTVDIDNSEGTILEGKSIINVSASTLSAQERSTYNVSRIQQTGRWYATDYLPGDISLGQYEVKLGDTLWEIAEAVYGDGFMWTKILEDNSTDIGFLPDGSQALIIPGQILIINK